jgi:hypothetical protein
MKFSWLLPTMLLAGCADVVASTSGVTTSAPASIASLTVTKGVARVGEEITFTVRLTSGSTARRTGAYAARIEYDPADILYAGEATATSGLVAANDERGVLRVAGASLDGYADGVLFDARFKVKRRAPVGELRLVIDQLRDVGAVDRLPAETAIRTAILHPWQ